MSKNIDKYKKVIKKRGGKKGVDKKKAHINNKRKVVIDKGLVKSKNKTQELAETYVSTPERCSII
ncbi:hypothetical protein, partial [Arcobacter sp. CECT 8985]|uniref:hypothetical protein n=1 Tax=Arcobacter sp. CECT 8985 TaxID=1935424 RepID=UPI00215A0BB5